MVPVHSKSAKDTTPCVLVDEARDVAEGIDGEVALLCVVPHPITESMMPKEWPSVLQGLVSSARSRLDQLIVSEGLKANTTVHVLDGPIGKTLCNATADIHADLLFVGCRGKGGYAG